MAARKLANTGKQVLDLASYCPRWAHNDRYLTVTITTQLLSIPYTRTKMNTSVYAFTFALTISPAFPCFLFSSLSLLSRLPLGSKSYYTLPYNSTGIAGNETIKVHAIETLRKYGVGSCGPPGFYGTIGASLCCHCAFAVMNDFGLQMSAWTLSATGADLALYRGLYFLLSGFSTILCVISAFAKRGDVIVADRVSVLLFRRAY
ncbi:hypothetical protein EDB89DRAFT_273535 [Lactarius sanguifluus]|nr:hypothetical protein EDB89DRAFT_273535 [Lactarius sanguifluus]